MTTDLDREMMTRALGLARRSAFSARPNPTVGCVIARDGDIIGEGATQPWGQAHAERVALEQCGDPAGATVYVTLEPCAHRGKTEPCADALVAAGVSRVFIAMRDPNPEAGGGLEKLRAADMDVELGLLEAEAVALNRGFCQRLRTGRPRVRVKLAMSLDGRTALASGESQWITGPDARADVQTLRAGSDAIVTGIGTVLADDPALTVRDPALDIQFQPLRVVVDSQLRTAPSASILKQSGSVLIAHASSAAAAGEWQAAASKPAVPEAAAPKPAAPKPASPLHPAGGDQPLELLALPGADKRVDLAQLVAELGTRQVNDILVECGPRLAGAFVAGDLVDELIVYAAPVLLGSNGRPLLELPIDSMAGKRSLVTADLCRVGDDVRWTLCPTNP